MGKEVFKSLIRARLPARQAGKIMLHNIENLSISSSLYENNMLKISH